MTFSAPSTLNANRVVLLAKIESTYNTDAAPVVGSDAFLVAEPDYRVDATIIERNFARPSLSPLATTVGRKLATISFNHDVKGSGASATKAKLATLLRGCGFAETSIANSAAATISSTTAGSANAGATISWAKTTASTKTGRYKVQVVKGGASATAKLRVSGAPGWGDDTVLRDETFSATVTRDDGTAATMTLTQGLTAANDYSSITYTVAGSFTVGDVVIATVGGVKFRYKVVTGDTDADGVATSLAALIDADSRLAASATGAVVTVTFASGAVATATTSGSTAITIGGTSAQITPTWSSNLTLGDYWIVQVLEPGYHYTPVSSNFESLTIHMYRDGILHKMTGCMGTVSFSGEAGQVATANFTFTGQFVTVVDQTHPTSGIVLEDTIAKQVENAKLTLAGEDDFCAQSFSIDMQNTVTPRDCINASDGYNGVRITNRQTQGSINPETVLEQNHPFWANMASSALVTFGVQVGSGAGETIKFFSDSVQYGSLSYGDRNNILTYDVPLRFSSYDDSGDDELRIVFP